MSFDRDSSKMLTVALPSKASSTDLAMISHICNLKQKWNVNKARRTGKPSHSSEETSTETNSVLFHGR